MVSIRRDIVGMGPSILAVALAALLASSAAGQKRLVPAEPEDGLLAEHRARVRTVLKDVYGPDIRLRAVVEPSFQVEYAVALRQEGSGYEIVTLRPSRQIWTYAAIARLKSGHAGTFRTTGDDFSGDLVDTTAESIADLREGLPENPADLPVSRCAAPVDADTAAGLLRAWHLMLLQVRPDKNSLGGADGTTYSFSMEEGGRTLSGETWSPRRRTRPARLAAIAEAMLGYCQTRDPSQLRRISELARKLGGRDEPRSRPPPG
jgi:hypothetical protein